jgi:hypothetical protein
LCYVPTTRRLLIIPLPPSGTSPPSLVSNTVSLSTLASSIKFLHITALLATRHLLRFLAERHTRLVPGPASARNRCPLPPSSSHRSQIPPLPCLSTGHTNSASLATSRPMALPTALNPAVSPTTRRHRRRPAPGQVRRPSLAPPISGPWGSQHQRARSSISRQPSTSAARN